MVFHIDPSMKDSVSAVDVRLLGIPVEAGYDAGYTIDEPVELNAKARSLRDGVEMEGTISGAIHTQCARCLCDVEYPVNIEFCEFFSEEGGEEVYPIVDDDIPMDRMILEAISLSLPNRIICREDCKGLCPVCGCDLNKEQCDCSTNNEKDSPFSQLKGLFDKDKEV